jgi:hypothetical protein
MRKKIGRTKIVEDIEFWIDANRQELPLNIKYWSITVVQLGATSRNRTEEIENYNGEPPVSLFYKPISRLYTIKI